jgi:hypothetical protein
LVTGYMITLVYTVNFDGSPIPIPGAFFFKTASGPAGLIES